MSHNIATRPTADDARMTTKFGQAHGGMSGYFLVFAALKLIITIACFGGFVIVNAYVHDIDLKSVLALCFVAFCLVVELILAFLFIRVRYVVAVLGTIAVICFVAFRESGMLLQ